MTIKESWTLLAKDSFKSFLEWARYIEFNLGDPFSDYLQMYGEYEDLPRKNYLAFLEAWNNGIINGGSMERYEVKE